MINCIFFIDLCDDLINVLGPFTVILRPRNFYDIEFTCASSACETALKITKISMFWLLTSNWVDVFWSLYAQNVYCGNIIDE